MKLVERRLPCCAKTAEMTVSKGKLPAKSGTIQDLGRVMRAEWVRTRERWEFNAHGAYNKDGLLKKVQERNLKYVADMMRRSRTTMPSTSMAVTKDKAMSHMKVMSTTSPTMSIASRPPPLLSRKAIP